MLPQSPGEALCGLMTGGLSAYSVHITAERNYLEQEMDIIGEISMGLIFKLTISLHGMKVHI